MIFVAHHNSPEVMQPSKQAFDFPAPFVTTKFSAVLRPRLDAVSFMRRNQFNVEFRQLRIERVRIVGFVADYFPWSLVDEPLANSLSDKSDFVRRSTRPRKRREEDQRGLPLPFP